MRMNREQAITRIEDYFERGEFFAELARRVVIHAESQEPGQRPELYRYLSEEMWPSLDSIGFSDRAAFGSISPKAPTVA
jgi:hypothetical protein